MVITWWLKCSFRDRVLLVLLVLSLSEPAYYACSHLYYTALPTVPFYLWTLKENWRHTPHFWCQYVFSQDVAPFLSLTCHYISNSDICSWYVFCPLFLYKCLLLCLISLQLFSSFGAFLSFCTFLGFFLGTRPGQFAGLHVHLLNLCVRVSDLPHPMLVDVMRFCQGCRGHLHQRTVETLHVW